MHGLMLILLLLLSATAAQGERWICQAENVVVSNWDGTSGKREQQRPPFVIAHDAGKYEYFPLADADISFEVEPVKAMLAVEKVMIIRFAMQNFVSLDLKTRRYARASTKPDYVDAEFGTCIYLKE